MRVQLSLCIDSEISFMLQNYITNNTKFFLRNNKVIDFFLFCYQEHNDQT